MRCAVGYNLRWLMRVIRPGLKRFLLCLFRLAYWSVMPA